MTLNFNPYVRLHYQVLGSGTVSRVDLRSHSHEPEFKDAIYALREAQDAAWHAVNTRYGRRVVKPYYDAVQQLMDVEHRLAAHVGLEYRYRTDAGFYSVPIETDLHELLTIQRGLNA